jgi:hypothetical protein
VVFIIPEEQIEVLTERVPELVEEEQVQVTGGVQEAPEAPFSKHCVVEVHGEHE